MELHHEKPEHVALDPGTCLSSSALPPETRGLLGEALTHNENVATSSTVAGISVCCLARGSGAGDLSSLA
eukprot:scaffold260060_cov45-Prasinocladus_malaysianus.AAC.1